MMDELTKDLILLNAVTGVGYIRLKSLLEEFKTPKALFNASPEELKRVKGIGEATAEFIRTARSKHDIGRELTLIEKNNVMVITIFDEDYPRALKETYDPPIVLYIKGQLKKTDMLAVSIVGSRRCTQYGLRTASRIAEELGYYGITVISGLARGIDTAAHKGAVKANGRTIAVLGNGLSCVYPAENKRLADDIIKNGALISEFPMEMPPHKINFPRRNRVISGLSKGVVVVEAGKKSGALITAEFALSEGREVFAVPGPAGNITSEGTNNLIREGAKLVENAGDIIEELNIQPEASALVLSRNGERPLLTDLYEKSIYEFLSDTPSDIDSIAEKLLLGPKQTKTALLKLEMRGVIKQLPGKLYVRAI